MLHQIRKMVGLVMAISRGITSVETMTKAFQTLKLDLPTAPALGLMLEQVCLHLCVFSNVHGQCSFKESYGRIPK